MSRLLASFLSLFLAACGADPNLATATPVVGSELALGKAPSLALPEPPFERFLNCVAVTPWGYRVVYQAKGSVDGDTWFNVRLEASPNALEEARLKPPVARVIETARNDDEDILGKPGSRPCHFNISYDAKKSRLLVADRSRHEFLIYDAATICSFDDFTD